MIPQDKPDLVMQHLQNTLASLRNACVTQQANVDCYETMLREHQQVVAEKAAVETEEASCISLCETIAKIQASISGFRAESSALDSELTLLQAKVCRVEGAVHALEQQVRQHTRLGGTVRTGRLCKRCYERCLELAL